MYNKIRPKNAPDRKWTGLLWTIKRLEKETFRKEQTCSVDITYAPSILHHFAKLLLCYNSSYFINIVFMFTLRLRDSKDNLNGNLQSFIFFSDSSLVVTFCHGLSYLKFCQHWLQCLITKKSHACEQLFMPTIFAKKKILLILYAKIDTTY